MAIADSSISTFSFGNVVTQTFSVIGRNLAVFATLSLIAALPSAALQFLTASTLMVRGANPLALFTPAYAATYAASLIVSLLFALVLQASLVHGSIADLNGRRASVGESLAVGIRMFFPLLGITILFGLAFFGLLILYGIIVGLIAALSGLGASPNAAVAMIPFIFLGFIVGLVPFFTLFAMWAVVVPAYVVERNGVFAAFGRSRLLTSGHRWPIIGLLVVYVVLIIVLSMVIGALSGVSILVSTTPSSTFPVVATITRLVSGTIQGVVGATGIASIYYLLRTSKEGIGPAHLAAVFE